MLLDKTKQQRITLNAKGFKAPRLIPVTMLSIIMSMGAAAGHSALSQDSALGHIGRGAAPHVAGGAAPAPSFQTKLGRAARNIVRGMQQLAKPAREPKPIVRVLDGDDERAYRDLFAALHTGNLKEAETLAGDVKDGALLGAAQAMFLLHPRNPNVRLGDLTQWLKAYGELPQAPDIYKKALSMRIAGDEALPLLPRKSAVPAKRKPTMVETLEWKKPRAFAVDALWRAGKFEEVLEKLRDVDGIENAAPESYYPLWIKGLAAFAVEDYAAAAQSFIRVSQGQLPEVNRTAAAYWAGRALERTLQNEQAAFYFEQAAQHPHSYYGMLAMAHKANNEAAVNDQWREPSLTTHHISALRQNKVGARALAFLQIGEKDLALKELQSISDKPALQDALEALSDAAQLPIVIQPRGSKQASHYPMLPWRPQGGFVSDPSLVMAIAWNESRFEPRALSPSGARGIMQIMPDTAERIMVGSSGSLYNAEASVTLGDLYIHKLSGMNGINGNLLLVIAGYNCGPGKVQQLYNDAQRNSIVGSDPLLFIETMPLKETRDYVQKVLATYAAYRLRLGKPLDALASLSRGEWPVYETVRTASK